MYVVPTAGVRRRPLINVSKRVQASARKLVHGANWARGVVAMRLGQIASEVPLSTNYGWDRGQPIDRLYIDQFLTRNASDIRGHVVEVGDDAYSRKYGAAQVNSQDVLSLHADNPLATIVGDIADPQTLPSARFDCLIATQVLQYVFDLRQAVQQIRRSLKPRGVALITVPAIAPFYPEPWQDEEDCLYWRFSRHSLRRLLEGAFDRSKIDVTAHGNLYAATAFLHGAAQRDLSKRKLMQHRAGYAITITARAVA